MSKFFIEKVIASGSGKEDAIVTFNSKLNIIQGRSDTGKTCILKCIDYIFGSSELPFDLSTRYSHVSMIVVTEQGPITFNRDIGKNKIEVFSLDEHIESGTYYLEYKKDKERLVMNDLCLKLIGINEEHKIVSNINFEKKRLTWKTILKILYVNEEDIARSVSIVEPVQYVEKTLFLSALLFLISGRDFSETDAKAKKEIRSAQKKAVESYLNIEIKNASERKNHLNNNLMNLDNVDIEGTVDNIIKELEKTEATINQAVNDSKELLSQIMISEEKSAECDVLQSRYQSLKSQYKADINRLTFIVNGEVEMKQIPKNTQCPFCDGKISTHNKKSYIETARAELTRIIAQLKGLSETEEDLKKEKVAIQNELMNLINKRTDVERLINEELKPKTKHLTKTVEEYSIYRKIKDELTFIDDYTNSWKTHIRQLSIEDEGDSLAYRPKEYFDENFITVMDDYAQSILQECNYENLITASFNIKDFDIEVNGGKKATNHGQGYRAFLNTVVMLMFRKYLFNHAKYNPGLLIIDSPLLGLDQGVNDEAPESMRTALFKYFINNQNEGQLIIVENSNTTPKLEYEAFGANVITFTKGKSKGRYGFLHDIPQQI